VAWAVASGPKAECRRQIPGVCLQSWKSTFVSGDKVIRPEHQNDTISEGIAYGMLIAVNMNDHDLFIACMASGRITGVHNSLMTSCVPGGPPDGGAVTSPPCAASGGSARARTRMRPMRS